MADPAPVICGWCGVEITADARAEIRAGAEPSHGICETCSDTLFPSDNPPGALGLLNAPEQLERFSGRVYTIRYRHDDDGTPYEHEFAEGVELWALPGGSVLVKHSDPNRRVWDDLSS